MKKVCALLIFAGLCAAVFISSPTASSQGRKDKMRKNANKIENNYIVVLDENWVGEKGKFSIAPYIAAEMAAMHKGQPCCQNDQKLTNSVDTHKDIFM